jgi:hypothetical protein
MAGGTPANVRFFNFGAYADAAEDMVDVFYAYVPIRVVEVGCFITTNIVPGGTSVEICEFDITSASVGVTGAEGTAPSRGSSTFSLTTSSTNVTHEDGKCLYERCDFTVGKGETLTAQTLSGATSGAGQIYMLYQPLGQADKVANNQDGGTAAHA